MTDYSRPKGSSSDEEVNDEENEIIKKNQILWKVFYSAERSGKSLIVKRHMRQTGQQRSKSRWELSMSSAVIYRSLDGSSGQVPFSFLIGLCL